MGKVNVKLWKKFHIEYINKYYRGNWTNIFDQNLDLLIDLENNIGGSILMDFKNNMTTIEEGYRLFYISMMDYNIGFNHTEFWIDGVQKVVEAYQKWARYLYDYELYKIEVQNKKDTFVPEPVFEDEIIYEYIETL